MTYPFLFQDHFIQKMIIMQIFFLKRLNIC